MFTISDNRKRSPQRLGTGTEWITRNVYLTVSVITATEEQ